MNDEFKQALDKVNPSNDTVERLIHAQVKLFRNALTLLCLGLVLISFRINVERIELAFYTTWIGAMILLLGMWMLRHENARMRVAFWCCVLNLVLQTISYWVRVFRLKNEPAFTYSMMAITFVSLTIEMYALFSSLRELALRFENLELAKRMMRAFGLYMSLFVLILLCFAIPFLIYPAIIYALVVLFYMPVTIHKLKAHVPLGKRVTSVKVIKLPVLIVLVVYIFATIGGQFIFLYSANSPNPPAQIYAVAHSSAADAMRKKLWEFGMPQEIANDLPDEEVMLYMGIYHSNTQKMESVVFAPKDDGIFELFSFIAILPNGKVRSLYYYRWRTLPKHAFIDVIAITVPSNGLVLLEIPLGCEKGISLYDKDGITFSQTLLSEATTDYQYHFDYGYITSIKFRLYPDYENQRGYVAVTNMVSRFTIAQNLTVMATYIHQDRLWNIPYADPLDYIYIDFMSGVYNTNNLFKAFSKEGFIKTCSYFPQEK